MCVTADLRGIIQIFRRSEATAALILRLDTPLNFVIL